METNTLLVRTDVEFLTLAELASVLRIAPMTAYRIVRKRLIPVYRVCRKILFRRTDVLQYLAACRYKSINSQ